MANIQNLWKFNCSPIYPVCSGEVIAALPTDINFDDAAKHMQEIAIEFGMLDRDEDTLFLIGQVDLDLTDEAGWDDWEAKILTVQNGNH